MTQEERELFLLIREFRAKRLLGEKSEAQVLWEKILDFKEFREIRRQWGAEKLLKNMDEEKIVSLRITVFKTIEITNVNIVLSDVEKTIEAWVKQQDLGENSYTVEGKTNKGRIIEFIKQDSQAGQDTNKPGRIQRMFSYFK